MEESKGSGNGTQETHQTAPSCLYTVSASCPRDVRLWRRRGIPSQCLCELVCVALNVENLDCFIGRAGRQSASIVVKHGIMLMWCTRLALISMGASASSGRIDEWS